MEIYWETSTYSLPRGGGGSRKDLQSQYLLWPTITQQYDLQFICANNAFETISFNMTLP